MNLVLDGHTNFVAQFLKQIREKSTGQCPLDFNYQMTLIKFEKTTTVSFVKYFIGQHKQVLKQ